MTDEEKNVDQQAETPQPNEAAPETPQAEPAAAPQPEAAKDEIVTEQVPETKEPVQEPEQPKQEAKAEPAKEEPKKPSAEETLKAELAKEHDNYLRLAAEYDNFRKRSQKEKDNLYVDIKAETVEKFLPVYDNLERALAQQTTDEAFKKGVEMTMTQLTSVFEKLGAVPFGAVGEPFDPTLHNAVMHAEDENEAENVIIEVFQKGFRIGDKVVRFAMVKVAN